MPPTASQGFDNPHQVDLHCCGSTLHLSASDAIDLADQLQRAAEQAQESKMDSADLAQLRLFQL